MNDNSWPTHAASSLDMQAASEGRLTVDLKSSMLGDERGRQELELFAPELLTNDTPAEQSPDDLPATYQSLDGQGTIMRVLDNFTLCDSKGKMIPLEQLDSLCKLPLHKRPKLVVFGTALECKAGTDPQLSRCGDALRRLNKNYDAGLPDTSPEECHIPTPEECHERAKEIVRSTPLPASVSHSVTVLALGEIRSGAVVRYKRYHSDKYIWPVGWKSEREFFSYVNVGTRVKYTCEILDGGGMGPKFTVTASDDVDNPTSAATPTGAWQAVASRVHKARDKAGEPTKSAPAVSGPEFFGFSTTLGASLIEGLPGALSCKQYIFRDQRGKGKPRVEAGSAVEVAKQQKKRSSRSRRKSAGAKAKAPERPANLIEAVVAAVDKQQSLADGKISLKLIRQMTEQSVGRSLSDRRERIKEIVHLYIGSKLPPQVLPIDELDNTETGGDDGQTSQAPSTPVPTTPSASEPATPATATGAIAASSVPPPPHAPPVMSDASVPPPPPPPPTSDAVAAPASTTAITAAVAPADAPEPSAETGGDDGDEPMEGGDEEEADGDENMDGEGEEEEGASVGSASDVLKASFASRGRQRVVIDNPVDWCIDYNYEHPSVWLITESAWYRVADTLAEVGPSRFYRSTFRVTQLKFEACTTTARILMETLPTNRNTGYKIVVDDLHARTLLALQQSRQVLDMTRRGLDATAVLADNKLKTNVALYGLNSAGMFIDEDYMVANAAFVAEQMTQLDGPNATGAGTLYSQSRFVSALTRKGQMLENRLARQKMQKLRKDAKVKALQEERKVRDSLRDSEDKQLLREKIHDGGHPEDILAVIHDRQVVANGTPEPYPLPQPVFPGVHSVFAADIVGVWTFLQSFADALQIKRCALDDFAQAMAYEGGDSRLFTTAMVALSRAILEAKKTDAASNDAPGAGAAAGAGGDDDDDDELDEEAGDLEVSPEDEEESAADRHNVLRAAVAKYLLMADTADMVNVSTWQEVVRMILWDMLTQTQQKLVLRAEADADDTAAATNHSAGPTAFISSSAPSPAPQQVKTEAVANVAMPGQVTSADSNAMDVDETPAKPEPSNTGLTVATPGQATAVGSPTPVAGTPHSASTPHPTATATDNNALAAGIGSAVRGGSAALNDCLTVCLEILEKIMKTPSAAAFLSPVEAEQGVDMAEYRAVVTDPMDLSTVKKRLLAGYYNPIPGDTSIPRPADRNGQTNVVGAVPNTGHRGVAFDVRLTFQNCMKFNDSSTEIAKNALYLKGFFDASYRKRVAPVAALEIGTRELRKAFEVTRGQILQEMEAAGAKIDTRGTITAAIGLNAVEATKSAVRQGRKTLAQLLKIDPVDLTEDEIEDIMDYESEQQWSQVAEVPLPDHLALLNTGQVVPRDMLDSSGALVDMGNDETHLPADPMLIPAIRMLSQMEFKHMPLYVKIACLRALVDAASSTGYLQQYIEQGVESHMEMAERFKTALRDLKKIRREAEKALQKPIFLKGIDPDGMKRAEAMRKKLEEERRKVREEVQRKIEEEVERQAALDRQKREENWARIDQLQQENKEKAIAASSRGHGDEDRDGEGEDEHKRPTRQSARRAAAEAAAALRGEEYYEGGDLEGEDDDSMSRSSRQKQSSAGDADEEDESASRQSRPTRAAAVAADNAITSKSTEPNAPEINAEEAAALEAQVRTKAQEVRQLKAKLAAFDFRPLPVGEDRYRRRYWLFALDEDDDSDEESEEEEEQDAEGNKSSSKRPSDELVDGQGQRKCGAARLFVESRDATRLLCYGTRESLISLMDWLSERGVREPRLQAALNDKLSGLHRQIRRRELIATAYQASVDQYRKQFQAGWEREGRHSIFQPAAHNHIFPLPAPESALSEGTVDALPLVGVRASLFHVRTGDDDAVDAPAVSAAPSAADAMQKPVKTSPPPPTAASIGGSSLGMMHAAPAMQSIPVLPVNPAPQLAAGAPTTSVPVYGASGIVSQVTASAGYPSAGKPSAIAASMYAAGMQHSTGASSALQGAGFQSQISFAGHDDGTTDRVEEDRYGAPTQPLIGDRDDAGLSSAHSILPAANTSSTVVCETTGMQLPTAPVPPFAITPTPPQQPNEWGTDGAIAVRTRSAAPAVQGGDAEAEPSQFGGEDDPAWHGLLPAAMPARTPLRWTPYLYSPRITTAMALLYLDSCIANKQIAPAWRVSLARQAWRKRVGNCIPEVTPSLYEQYYKAMERQCDDATLAQFRSPIGGTSRRKSSSTATTTGDATANGTASGDAVSSFGGPVIAVGSSGDVVRMDFTDHQCVPLVDGVTAVRSVLADKKGKSKRSNPSRQRIVGGAGINALMAYSYRKSVNTGAVTTPSTLTAGAPVIDAGSNLEIAVLSASGEREALSTMQKGLIELEKMLLEHALAPTVIGETWSSLSQSWRASVEAAGTYSQVGLLTAALQQHGVQWSAVEEIESDVDKRGFFRLAAGVAERAYVPDVGERLMYFGTGHEAQIVAEEEAKRADERNAQKAAQAAAAALRKKRRRSGARVTQAELDAAAAAAAAEQLGTASSLPTGQSGKVKRTGSQALMLNKAREGVSECVVRRVTYHTGSGDPYARVTLMVRAWYHPDADRKAIAAKMGKSGAARIELNRLLKKVWNAMHAHPSSAPFQQPVDTATYGDYGDYVSEPMDLGTMANTLNQPLDAAKAALSGRNIRAMPSGGYNSLAAFESDMEKIASNCTAYCEGRFPELPVMANAVVQAGRDAMRKHIADIKKAEAALTATLTGDDDNEVMDEDEDQQADNDEQGNDDADDADGPNKRQKMSDGSPGGPANADGPQSAPLAPLLTPEQVQSLVQQRVREQEPTVQQRARDSVLQNTGLVAQLQAEATRIAAEKVRNWLSQHQTALPQDQIDLQQKQIAAQELAALQQAAIARETATALQAVTGSVRAAISQQQEELSKQHAAAAAGGTQGQIFTEPKRKPGRPRRYRPDEESLGTWLAKGEEREITVVVRLCSDQAEYLVPYVKYARARDRHWKPGDRFKMFFGDSDGISSSGRATRGHFYTGMVFGMTDFILRTSSRTGDNAPLGYALPWEAMSVRWDADGNHQQVNPWEVLER